MEIKDITAKEKLAFDAVVSHPLQTYEWGEFREKTGIRVIREGFFEKNKLISGFSLTLHKIPRTNWQIGYLPKGDFPSQELIAELKRVGEKNKCVFIQLEPNVQDREAGSSPRMTMQELGLIPAAHPLFTKYTFLLDLTKSEEDLLKQMHSKARYNIRVAQRHGVEVIEDNSQEGFEAYWKLMEETTKRQSFYAHSKRYHELVWEILASNNKHNALSAHLFLAKYQGKVLTAWMTFVFQDTLYYPYGASSGENRETMHSSLMMWEVIRFGKKLGLKKFDMWGAMGDNPDTNDPWYGFHDFKRKFGPDHIAFVGSYDLVIHPILYQGYKLADTFRWMYLKFKK
jgi:lipid II:glycine glycyltransferase (peptidoglycan interpeptide bridge formation enzyme)